MCERIRQAGHMDATEQPQFCNTVSELAVITVAGVGQHRAERNAGGVCGAQLVQRDLRFGLEMGRLAWWLAIESETTAWQSSCLPSWPQYCRATPTECLPFLGTRCHQ
jgi:hypothetical protein